MSGLRGCTQCGNCLEVCPVCRLTDHEELSPKAKHIQLEALAEEGAPGSELNARRLMLLAERCASCGRCAVTCPRKLSVPESLAHARAQQPGWQQWVWERWILSGKLLWPASAALAKLIPSIGGEGFIQGSLASAKVMATPPGTSPWFVLAPGTSTPGNGRKLAVFAGCTASRVRPAWVDTSSALLTRLGYSLAAEPSFICCGATLHHAGILDAAAKAQRHNLEVWRALGRPALVVFCASCHHGLAGYAKVPGLMEQEEAAQWAKSVTPLSRLLSPEFFTTTAEAPESAAYHSPCHWDGKDPDLPLLRALLPGLKRGTSLCCGLGGVLKLGNPGLSTQLARACWTGFSSGTFDNRPIAALTGCSGCVLQLSGAAPEGGVVRHWLDVVAKP